MKFSIVVMFFSLISFLSCSSNPTDFATKWTNEIKEKIIGDANESPTRTVIDSAHNYLTLYNGSKKLKYFMLRSNIDTTSGKVLSIDTLVSIFYSSDERFQLIKELCPAIERSFEGINYEGIGPVGLTELRFCDGKIKESGFRFGKPVGIWKKFDSTGKVIEETDNGNVELLNKLRDIKFYR